MDFLAWTLLVLTILSFQSSENRCAHFMLIKPIFVIADHILLPAITTVSNNEKSACSICLTLFTYDATCKIHFNKLQVLTNYPIFYY